MRVRREIKQFGFVPGLMLLLFVSSFGVCICPHHREKAAAEALSCRSHASEAAPQATTSNDSAAQTAPASVSGDECCCVQSNAPKIAAQPESVKAEKQPVALAAEHSAAVSFAAQVVSVRHNFPPESFYPTGSFYNPARGRAPPRL